MLECCLYVIYFIVFFETTNLAELPSTQCVVEMGTDQEQNELPDTCQDGTVSEDLGTALDLLPEHVESDVSRTVFGARTAMLADDGFDFFDGNDDDDDGSSNCEDDVFAHTTDADIDSPICSVRDLLSLHEDRK